MSLGEHLIEFRKRLLIAAIGLLVGMIIAFLVTSPVMEFLTQPIRVLDTAEAELMVTTVTGSFDLIMRMALSIGLILSAPVWLWQAWAFIMPGLTKREIRYTVGFLSAAIPLFFAGAVTAVFLAPNVIKVMSSLLPDGTVNFFEAKQYYDFILKFVLAIGVGFVIPVFLVALNIAGIISGRALLKGWRPAVLIATLFAAITTPAMDAFSMLLLAGVLVLLYFLAAFLAVILDRVKKKRDPLLIPDIPV